MYKPYKKPLIKALPDVRIPEPRISKFFIFICRFLSRPYLFLFYGLARIKMRGEQILFDAFKRALAGESRCIIAFRHSSGAEPQLLTWFFLYRLKALAAAKGVRFARKPHALFVYGYEVARWGGWLARLIMPNLGAMPIHHSKIDTRGMARIYRAIVEDSLPLALAPEGQVSYTADSIPRLEPGIVRIGFQAAERLTANNVNIPVEILPVSIHKRYNSGAQAAAERLLRKIEKLCGFSRKTYAHLPWTERLGRCRDYLLGINEARYNIKSDTALSFEERLEHVINTALETAERMLGIKSTGDYFARLYKVRQVCWDRIYLPGMDNFKRTPYAERNLMDMTAGEAWYITRHQELADFCWYFRCPLPTEKTALHNKIEYIQNLWDFANRTMGGALANRINIHPCTVIIQTALPIDLSGQLRRYKADKKAVIDEKVSELEKAYNNCINDINSM